ncbi:hypothetical protein FPV67DRAFT_1561929 [Lyophyllum atratum]|nr:hypothetical protein FPV67DRAFT_1561929 [Lyophyllum atratum]
MPKSSPNKPTPNMPTKPTKKCSKKVAQAAPMATLATAAEENVEKFNKVVNTNKSYAVYTRGLHRFLDTQIADREARNISICEEGIPTEELAKALDNPPNQYSAILLERYITQKCFIEKCKKGVAELAHGAACRYWDTMDGDKYAGDYKLDEKTKMVSGCPARAPCVLEIKKAVLTRSKNDGATRGHAEAITREDMVKMTRRSEQLCSNERLEHRRLLFEHGFMRAFSTSSFIIWMRCFEALSMTVGDLEMNCFSRGPYYTPHFRLHLNNRKGWQNAQGYDGPRQNNVYEVYAQDVPEIDMYTHLLRWLRVLAALLGRELKPSDHVFPPISPNGSIDPDKEMSYDSLMKMLKRYTMDAGIDRNITSHAFRRGGSQDRFVFAPPALRWSLNRVRWWGGWAQGENVDTLMKYLLDSLQSYENTHSDALHPVPRGSNGLSAIGEGASVTVGEIRELKRSVDEKMDSLDRNMEHRMDNMVSQISARLGATHLPTVPLSWPVSRDPQQDAYAAHTMRTASAPYPPRAASVSSHAESVSGSSDDSQSLTGRKRTRQHLGPLSGVLIPNLKAGHGVWKRAIKQWEDGDDEIGLKALKDWPKEWYTDSMRLVTGSKRRERELVAIAYNK